jgi:hypothetical protein
MISLRKLFDRHTPQKVCVRAHDLFLAGLGVEEIVLRLRREGFTERVAGRAVTFLPSAFARVHYEKTGIAFPSFFFPGDSANQAGRSLRYADEPVFRAAMQLAAQLKRDGDWSQVWPIIEISAEHSLVAQGQEKGLTLKSISTLIHEL